MQWSHLSPDHSDDSCLSDTLEKNGEEEAFTDYLPTSALQTTGLRDQKNWDRPDLSGSREIRDNVRALRMGGGLLGVTSFVSLCDPGAG